MYLELPGADHLLFEGDVEAIVDAVARFAVADWVRDDDQTAGRRLVSAPFTDIVGSTELAGRLGDTAWRDLLQRFLGLCRQQRPPRAGDRHCRRRLLRPPRRPGAGDARICRAQAQHVTLSLITEARSMQPVASEADAKHSKGSASDLVLRLGAADQASRLNDGGRPNLPFAGRPIERPVYFGTCLMPPIWSAT
jgi:hypothetical protein